MTTEKPTLIINDYERRVFSEKRGISEMQATREMQALDLKLLTLDAGLFYQMRVPSIATNEYDDRLARAQAAAIGYVVAPDHQNRGINSIWLVVSEDGSLWRWSLIEAAAYDAACEDHEWLAEVPQLFLIGQPPVEHEGYPTYRNRQPIEQGED